MSDAVLVAGVTSATSVITGIVAALTAWRASRAASRSSKAANRIEEIEVALSGMEKLTAAQDRRIAAQDLRIAALEQELQTVKTALVAEQQQHAETRELLRIAMRHIRDMLSWLGSDRGSEPPAVPDELTHQL